MISEHTLKPKEVHTFEKSESEVRTQFIKLKNLTEMKGCCCSLHSEVVELEVMFNRLNDEYERYINVLEGDYSNDQDTIEELRDKVRDLDARDLEDFVTCMLKRFTGQNPSLGDVVSLKVDIENLLSTKYHISLTSTIAD